MSFPLEEWLPVLLTLTVLATASFLRGLLRISRRIPGTAAPMATSRALAPMSQSAPLPQPLNRRSNCRNVRSRRRLCRLAGFDSRTLAPPLAPSGKREPIQFQPLDLSSRRLAAPSTARGPARGHQVSHSRRGPYAVNHSRDHSANPRPRRVAPGDLPGASQGGGPRGRLAPQDEFRNSL